MAKYRNLERKPRESVQDFSTRFNKVYNSIPANINPPPGLALLNYMDGFDAEISYQLRKRNLATLEEIHKNIVDIEAKILVKKAKMEVERRGVVKEDFPPSSDNKLDALVKIMQRLIKKLTLQNKLTIREQQRRPPFQANFAEEGQAIDSCHHELHTNCFIYSLEDRN